MKNMGNVLRNQKGFTLIEIIAVLVILGILAAIAIPRYLNLQQQSQIDASQAAIASGASQLTLSYAECLLAQTTPTGIGADGTWTGCTASSATTTQGDFTVSYGGTAPSYLVALAGGPAWFTSNSAAILSGLGAMTPSQNPKVIVLQ